MSVSSVPSDWHRSLAEAIRDPRVLLESLGLSDELLPGAESAASLFPLMVPASYRDRMEPRNPHDPLLRQVLPLVEEHAETPGFVLDAVGDSDSKRAPGLLHKYHGRALLVTTGSCAIHCRYCFRRSYPYQEEPRTLNDWEPAFDVLRQDPSISEIILSGGDPLMLTEVRLSDLLTRCESIPHLSRVRIHSRLPIVLPNRVDDVLIDRLRSSQLTPIMVVHANHPNEIVGDCADSLRRLVESGITTLNQSVLLKGVNDSVEALAGLSERLINLGVMPYYLHQLDRVQGTAHFEVQDERALELITELRKCLPGYAVPQLVRELAGELHKVPLI
ncbi:MAG: EF-P beta-lysylation protein EpmB [Planctomycetaceae bacterium]|nr:EF-P beta-lysylation protein EpmB [Planctomycetaceae bacterium]MDG2390482.1 EF-P beta-lysylation protein EpmB [Planctomycetaceae bacterium]